jgi:hypothetical protein
MNLPMRATTAVSFLLCTIGPSMAGPKSTKPKDVDAIEIAGHLALDGTALKGITSGEHFRRQFVYLSWAGQVKVIDVTQSAAPVVAQEYRYSAEPASHVQAVVGNVVLLDDNANTLLQPRTISIMSFADPQKPQVQKQFSDVTGFLNERTSSLIFIVNKEGLWILRKKPGRDVEFEDEYTRRLLYNN